MLDYEYVNKSDSPEELRAILEMLRSGKEGIYPHLIAHTEKRLLAVLPDKERKKALSMRQEPSQGDIAEATHDLGGWLDGMRRGGTGTAPKNGSSDSVIFQEASKAPRTASHAASRPLPPPRNQKHKGATEQGWKNEEKFALAKTQPTKSDEPDKKNRISGYDFRSWDLYNVDDECDKLDASERDAAEAKKSAAEAAQRAHADRISRAHARRSAELEGLRTSLEYEQRSPQEREFLAAHEKQKGNECYKAGEAEEAYLHYSRSLALSESSAVVYANRAMACIKLGRLEQAEMDCTRALEIDPKYSKAISRRGMTLHRRGRYREAMADFEAALALTPDDHALSELLRQSRAKFHEVSGVKLKIEEIGDGSGQRIAVRAAMPVPLPEGWTRTEPGATGFTRIAIDGDDDDDDDDDVQAEATASVDGALAGPAVTSAELKQRGLECCARGDYVCARSQFTAALDALPTGVSVAERTPLLNNLAACAMAMHDYDAVIDHTSAVLSNDAQNAKALLRRGAAFEKRGLYAEARDDMETLVAIDGNLVDAQNALERLRSLVPPTSQPESRGSTSSAVDETCAARAESLKNDGNVAMKNGDHLGAVDAYTRALELDSSNLAVRNNRALALLKLGRFTDAEQDTTAVLAVEPKNPKALYRRGAARRAHGAKASYDASLSLSLLERALTDFDTLCRLEPANAQASAEHATVKEDVLRARMRLLEEGKPRTPPAPTSDNASGTAEAEVQECPKTCLEPRATATRIVIEDDEDDDDAASAPGDGVHLVSEPKENGGSVTRITIEDESDAEEDNAPQAAVRISIEDDDDDDNDPGLPPPSPQEPEAPPRASGPTTRITIDEESDDDDEEAPAASEASSAPPPPAPSNGELSMAAKDEGVAAIGRGDLQAALEAFTRAVDLDGANVAARNNRALVHLRLGQYDLAVGDASAVLAAEPHNTKALFRRGTARKALATALVMPDPAIGPLLDTALADFDAAVKLEPANTAAQRERAAVATMRTEHEARMRVQRARPSEPRRTKVRAKAIPSTPPKTQYELEKVWRDLKSDPGALAQYIQTFKASTYKKVLKESLNEEVLSGMLTAACDHLSSEAAARMLQGISQSSGFAMWRMMMSEADKACVEDLIGRIRRDGDLSEETASAYGVE